MAVDGKVTIDGIEVTITADGYSSTDQALADRLNQTYPAENMPLLSPNTNPAYFLYLAVMGNEGAQDVEAPDDFIPDVVAGEGE